MILILIIFLVDICCGIFIILVEVFILLLDYEFDEDEGFEYFYGFSKNVLLDRYEWLGKINCVIIN